MVAAMGFSAAAVNSNGELYRWGNAMNTLPAQSSPARVGTASNWVYVSVATNNIFAINSAGELWALGANGNGQLGSGNTFAQDQLLRVGDRSDWVSVSAAGSTANNNSVLGITENGWLWGWGSNDRGRTGLGVTAGNTLSPTRIGTASNWLDARTINNTFVGAAVNSEGHLYTWGATGAVRGCGGVAGDILTPRRVGTAANWIQLSGGNNHLIAVNTSRELYAWGANGSGQLGLGDSADRNAPTFVMETFGVGTLSRGGGTRTLMLLRSEIEPGTLPITKEIDTPAGTTIPQSRFYFDIRQVTEGTSGNFVLADPVNVDPSTVYVDFETGDHHQAMIVNALEDKTFNYSGDFFFVVTEIPDTNELVLADNETMFYSDQVFIVQVRVANDELDGIVPSQVHIFAATPAAGTDTWTRSSNEKLDELVFTNTFIRNMGDADYPALRISKVVEGTNANLTLPFNFAASLNLPTQMPVGDLPANITATVVNSTTGNPVVPPQTVTFVQGSGADNRNYTANFSLLDNRSLVFETLPAGTTHLVTETQNPEYAGSLLILSGGNVVFEDDFVQGANVSGGVRIVADTGENGAHFTNIHSAPPATGLFVNSIPFAAIALAVVTLVAVVLALRVRRRIERLPVSLP
jgi:hypothetical protein